MMIIYTLKDITLKYEIKEDFRESVIDLFTDNYTYDESLAGIKRLNVFKFFEEIDEEMPIDTSYDEDNNTVYVTLTNDSFESSDVVDGINVGSFSLVDLEVWGALMNEHLEEASDENAKIPSSSLPPSNQNAQMSRGYTASVAADDSFIGPPKPDRSNWEQNSKIFKNYISSRVRSQETDISTPVCYGGHYYAVVLANVGWSDAEVRCEALGGHLMTPATAGEFALMQGCLAPGNTTNHYWIGAHLVGGSWQWVNDEGAVTYIDTVPKKYVSGRYYGLSDYGRYISTELYYADGMSYYPFTTNPQIGYIIEWDSLSDYINGTSADSSYSIATLIKSMRGNVCLKSPLTKGSAVDSDGDGVPDYDELNLKLLKKVYGTTTPTKMVVSISTIIRALATKNTTSYTLVKKGTIAEKIETALKTTSSTVTGTTSIINTEYAYWNGDPMASDMDCDYLPDGEDSHKKRFDATPIDAALIDDSSMFTNRDNNKFYSIKAYSDKSTPTTTANEILVNADQKGGGSPSIMEIPENLKKIAITYNRNTNYNQDGRIEFCINAEDFHDYVFEISFDNASDAQAALNANSFMKVYSGTNPWKVQKELSADKKTLVCRTYNGLIDTDLVYHDLLGINGDITISLHSQSIKGNMECVVYQDDWVYAPDGGIRKSCVPGDYLQEIFLEKKTVVELIQAIEDADGLPEENGVFTNWAYKNDLTPTNVSNWVDNSTKTMKDLSQGLSICLDDDTLLQMYSNVSPPAQWVLKGISIAGKGCSVVLGVASAASGALAFLDAVAFFKQLSYNAKIKQLPNAIKEAQTQFQICLVTAAREPSEYSCYASKNRTNVNTKYHYLSRYAVGQTRCDVVSFN